MFAASPQTDVGRPGGRICNDRLMRTYRVQSGRNLFSSVLKRRTGTLIVTFTLIAIASLTAVSTSIAYGSTPEGTTRQLPAAGASVLKVARPSGTISFAEASNLSFPGHSGTVLHGVSCPTGSRCVAVGQDLGNYVGANGTIEISDTGAGWTPAPVAVPSPPPAHGDDSLSSVSCWAPGTCATVGDYESSQGTLPLVETEAGSAWQPAATVPLPAAANVPTGVLSAVSCTKAGTCLAVGAYGYLFNYHDMAVLSTGGQWARAQAVEVELPPGGAATLPGLDAVSCAGTSCLAVGEYDKSFYVKPGMAVAESGGHFQRAVEVKAPASNPTFIETTLSGVSCTGPATCAISGSYLNPKGDFVQAMVASEVDGAWQPSVPVELPANAAGDGVSSLNGIWCYDVGGVVTQLAAHCVAVGSYPDNGGVTRPMYVDETDGHWAQAVELNVPAGDGGADLDAVACSPGGVCAAVGATEHGDGIVAFSTATHVVTRTGTPPGQSSGRVSRLSVSLSTNASGASEVAYTLDFTTSASGALTPGGGDIDVAAPPGTVPDATKGCRPGTITVTDLTTDVSGSLAPCSATVSAHGSQMQFGTPVAIGAGDRAQVVITGLANPANLGRATLSVSTTYDKPASALYYVVPAGRISSVSALTSNPAAGAALTSYTLRFSTSVSGTLVAGSGLIVLSASPGTAPALANGCPQGVAQVTDLTTAASGSEALCSAAVTDNGGHVQLTTPVAIGAKDRVVVVLTDLDNPPNPGLQLLSLSTSSDVAAVRAPFATVAGARIAGHVGNSSGYPVAGGEVQACPTEGGPCYDAITEASGAYQLDVPAGHYALSVYPPATGQLSPTTAPKIFQVTTLSDVTGANFTLRVLDPLPRGVTIAGQYSGVPRMDSFDPTPMTVHSCRYGFGVVLIRGTNVRTGQATTLAYPLFETRLGSGQYEETIPPIWPVHGPVGITYSIYCVEALAPTAGLAAGGNIVTIHGKGFTGATAVEFGTVPATRFRVLSGSWIQAIAPPGSGTVVVEVRTPHGIIRGGALTSYTYVSLTSVTPSHGPASGSKTVARDELGPWLFILVRRPAGHSGERCL